MIETDSTRPVLTGLYIRNYAANLSGNLIIILLNKFTPIDSLKHWQDFAWQQGGILLIPFFLLLIFLTAGFLQYLIQRPVSHFLAQYRTGNEIDPEKMLQAKRRLLNLHVILALTNLALWLFFTLCITAALFYAVNISLISCAYIFFRGVIVGFIAAFLAFFLIDDFSRKKLIPVCFPEGRLTDLKGTVRIPILRRIRILYGAGTAAPMLVLIGTLGLILWKIDDSTLSLSAFSKEIFFFIVVLYSIFVAIMLSLNFLVSKSIITPIQEMMNILKKVRRGDFHQKVRVVSNDELGMLGDGINEMNAGLLERDRMQKSLNLANEIQQALLPQTTPEIKGLQLAAHINYCDETGGDYYDFFIAGDGDSQQLSVLIGDVSGHGVSAALLMVSARAFFRQRSALPGSISRIVSDVNRQLAADVMESGDFMTLFYLTIDLGNNCLHWVRAGHDPAILYDPESDEFEELNGSGIALGADNRHTYAEYKKTGLTQGSIIILGTDGIWEAQNAAGERFGKKPLRRITRQYAELDAKGLLTTCLFTLEKFRDGRKPDDDATLIIAKITDQTNGVSKLEL